MFMVTAYIVDQSDLTLQRGIVSDGLFFPQEEKERDLSRLFLFTLDCREEHTAVVCRQRISDSKGAFGSKKKKKTRDIMS